MLRFGAAFGRHIQGRSLPAVALCRPAASARVRGIQTLDQQLTEKHLKEDVEAYQKMKLDRFTRKAERAEALELPPEPALPKQFDADLLELYMRRAKSLPIPFTRFRVMKGMLIIGGIAVLTMFMEYLPPNYTKPREPESRRIDEFPKRLVAAIAGATIFAAPWSMWKAHRWIRRFDRYWAGPDAWTPEIKRQVLIRTAMRSMVVAPILAAYEAWAYFYGYFDEPACYPDQEWSQERRMLRPASRMIPVAVAAGFTPWAVLPAYAGVTFSKFVSNPDIDMPKKTPVDPYFAAVFGGPF
eukprot:TRINITY_DN22937_c0_g1_i1.p1 TRINITY_DN22937_c0_g1~~TRINITY_DN22937_c0_g1_i1.p1  ORF type:complete len:298 (-),score=24.46 TRINITY_DN22937_c0_g1_i1:778-1671(-)